MVAKSSAVRVFAINVSLLLSVIPVMSDVDVLAVDTLANDMSADDMLAVCLQESPWCCPPLVWPPLGRTEGSHLALSEATS